MSGHVVVMKLPITSFHSCSLLNHPNSFHREMFKLNAKCDAYSLLYWLSHFECNSHTVHIVAQWRLRPPLTGIVMSSLFMHAHSSPLSLAAWLHQCCANHSPNINNGWSFSRQIMYIHIYILEYLYSICVYVCMYVCMYVCILHIGCQHKMC